MAQVVSKRKYYNFGGEIQSIIALVYQYKWGKDINNYPLYDSQMEQMPLVRDWFVRFDTIWAVSC